MAIKDYLKRVYPGAMETFAQTVGEALDRGGKMFVVTANPEILMHAERETDLRAMLLDESVSICPDGVSVVKAMRSLGLPAAERITGVDLAERLLARAGETGKRVYLLGAKEEVVSALTEKLRRQYPAVTVAYHNGYDGDKDRIFSEEIVPFAPDLVLAALGVPAQERLIYRHFSAFEKGVFMGVGGSFDVLSGSKKRAPALFVKTNTEWLYRIAREPRRLGRFWNNNVKFLRKVRREK